MYKRQGEGAVHKAIAFHRAAAQYQNGFAAVEFPQLGERAGTIIEVSGKCKSCHSYFCSFLSLFFSILFFPDRNGNILFTVMPEMWLERYKESQSVPETVRSGCFCYLNGYGLSKDGLKA